MANENNIEFKNITEIEVVEKLAIERDKILEEFTKAYLAESGLLPSQVVLVTQQSPMDERNIIETIYFFRKKNG